VETPINESSQLDASKCNVKRVTLSWRNYTIVISFLFLLSFITHIHLRLEHSEQDLRIWNSQSLGRAEYIPIEIPREEEDQSRWYDISEFIDGSRS
jgi:hypothetical protein